MTETISLANPKVDLVFKDPTGKSAIERIYWPPAMHSPMSVNPISLSKRRSHRQFLEKRRQEAHRAIGTVEKASRSVWWTMTEGVSPLSRRARAQSDLLASPQFALFVIRLEGYPGFVIASDAAVKNELKEIPHRISVELKSNLPIRAPIAFSP